MDSKMHYQYYNSSTLLVVNLKGQIRIVYTPFRVICTEATNAILPNTQVYVEEIISNDRDQLHFVINGQVYLYSFFYLPIKFQIACL